MKGQKITLNLNPDYIKNKKAKESIEETKEEIKEIKVDTIEKYVEEKKEISGWDKVKAFYVSHSSKPTYVEVARTFNLEVEDVAQEAQKESWFERRLIYWNQVNADQKQNIYDANRTVFKSLSAVTQLAINDHAQMMLDIQKNKKKGILKNPKDYNIIYNIKDVMALVKLLNTNAEIVEKQLDETEKELKDLDDGELLALLSEDEQYELETFYSISEDNDDI